MTRVALGMYDIIIERGALDTIGDVARRVAPAHRYVVISDTDVAPIYSARVTESLGLPKGQVFVICAGEEHKTREQWMRLTDELLADGCGRDSTLIAVGGGVVGDLTGFVASTFMRGVPCIQVPTTLLAMIDASVGGKTGVDTPAGKNLVGTYHRPAAVVVDPDTLATLPAEHLRSGLAEAIKHGVIADEAYFERVVADAEQIIASPCGAAIESLIVRSIEIKADVVLRDEHEGGLRKTLNFGHTLGHAIETASDYRVLHGEAIAIGMVLESELAERVGVAEEGTAARVREAVSRAGLPHTLPPELSGAAAADAVIALTRSDKKARGGVAGYALPTRIGAMAGANTGWVLGMDEAHVREILLR